MDGVAMWRSALTGFFSFLTSYLLVLQSLVGRGAQGGVCAVV